MKKQEFLTKLQKRLKKRVPKVEIERAVLYYSELIDDEVENGLSEEKAISKLLPPDEIASSIAAEFFGEAEPESLSNESMGWQGYFRRKKGSGFGTVLKIIGLFFFCIIVIPVFCALLGASIGVLAGLWGGAVGIAASGIALPCYGVFLWGISSSAAIGLLHIAVGLLLLPLGLYGFKLLIFCSKHYFKALGATAKFFFSGLRA